MRAMRDKKRLTEIVADVSTDTVVCTGSERQQSAVGDAAGRRRMQPARAVCRVEVNRHAPGFPSTTAPLVARATATLLLHAACDAVGRRAYARHELPSSQVPPRYRL